MEVTEKFTGKADVYAKYRPEYPAEYIDYLVLRCGLQPGSVVADIGSGTGKLSRQLLERDFTVIAVEPNDHMRAVAEKMLRHNPNFISMPGTAENTGILDENADLVTVAQAFHWFDPEGFRVECARILKPGANVALVWNCRDYSSPLVAENEAICRVFCPMFNGFRNGFHDMPQIDVRFFGDGGYEYRAFESTLEYDLEGFVGRNLSASYAPREADGVYGAFVEAVAELFYKYSANGRVALPNITRSYVGRVQDKF